MNLDYKIKPEFVYGLYSRKLFRYKLMAVYASEEEARKIAKIKKYKVKPIRYFNWF